MQFNPREQQLFNFLKSESLSMSHQVDHLRRVATYAAELAELYNGRRDIVVAAALLHDLGRTDTTFRGKESAVEGARLAAPVLQECGYPAEDTKDILRCIAEHDQPELHSELLEARILKDADFLDGFGVWGVMRSVMYSTETGEGMKGVVERLEIKMRARLDGLEFLASKRLGWQQYRFVELFLDEMKQVHSVLAHGYRGALIVFEGISGCGKDTQAELLSTYLQKQGRVVTEMHHPTEFMKETIWRPWRTEVDDRQSELFLILADRVRMVRQVMLPALERGEVVISTRSTASLAVYQRIDKIPLAFYRYVSAFEPVPDLFIYLDVSAEVAFERTGKRVVDGTEKDRGFFPTKQAEQKQRYQEMLGYYPTVARVNADGTIAETAVEVENVLLKASVI